MPSDILLFFSGVQGKTDHDDFVAGGRRVDNGDQGSFDELTAIPDRNGYPRINKGWYGSIVMQRGINAASDFMNQCKEYVPGESKLIIYGYSAGGYNALTLCRLFDEYNRSSGDFLTPKNFVVDLLITIDAAARALTSRIDRTVGDCVKRNVNHYERAMLAETLDRSQGDKNTGKCNPENTLHLFTTHGGMQNKTMSIAVAEVKKCLGVQ